MNENVKIAKELVKIAKKLAVGYVLEGEEEDCLNDLSDWLDELLKAVV